MEALSPQLDIQQEKKLKSKLWDQEGRGHGEERTERTGKIKKRGKGGGGERTDGNGLCEGDTPNAHVTKLAEDSKVDTAGFGWFHFI